MGNDSPRLGSPFRLQLYRETLRREHNDVRRDRPVSSSFSTLDRFYSHFESPLSTEKREKKNTSVHADFMVPSIVKMKISANDDRFKFNTLAPVPPVALISQSVDATILCAFADYLVAQCQVHLAKEYRVHFGMISNAIRMRVPSKYSANIIFY